MEKYNVSGNFVDTKISIQVYQTNSSVVIDMLELDSCAIVGKATLVITENIENPTSADINYIEIKEEYQGNAYAEKALRLFAESSDIHEFKGVARACLVGYWKALGAVFESTPSAVEIESDKEAYLYNPGGESVTGEYHKFTLTL